MHYTNGNFALQTPGRNNTLFTKKKSNAFFPLRTSKVQTHFYYDREAVGQEFLGASPPRD